ncbi:MAG TPA: LCP family protein [Anaerolineae bacterium]|nr:LCP family protein [Anaerolineae bacterium]
MSFGLRTASPRASVRLWVAIVAVFLVLSGAASCAVFNAVRGTVREFQGFDLPAVRPAVTGAPSPIILPEWDGVERVNILLLGIDERAVEEGPWRTDTMILLTIDPATRSAGMLSIPRDLWVPIPGYDVEGKINTAHFIGDAGGYPGGGPALALATVQYNLGLPLQYYVRLNFGAFEKLIDLIGGLDLCLDKPIDDPQYPDSGFGYEPLYLPAGCQHMDGRLALKYARTRHTELGDFDRARRQQQVILAVRDKVTQANMLPTLIGQAGPLLETLGASVQTNFTLDQLIRLANLGSQIDLDKIQSLTIEPSMTLAYVAPTNPPQDVLIPIREEIRKLRDRLLNTGANASLPADADDATRLAAEAAAIRVENGTQTIGLAARTRDFLSAQGFVITGLGDAYDGLTDHASTLIIDHASKPFTAAKLAEALHLPPTAIRTAAANGDGVDIRLVLGNDFGAALGAQLLLTPMPTPSPTP